MMRTRECGRMMRTREFEGDGPARWTCWVQPRQRTAPASNGVVCWMRIVKTQQIETVFGLTVLALRTVLDLVQKTHSFRAGGEKKMHIIGGA